MVDRRLSRGKFLEHFANRAPCLVGLEACGGSQHWARRLHALGHEVRVVPAKMVRPFVSGNKNDAHDARAIHGARSALTHAKTPSTWQLQTGQASSAECGGRGVGEQDSAHDLGLAGP